MKHFNVLLFLCSFCSLNAQNVLTEDFLFGPFDSLDNRNGWHRSGNNSKYNFMVTSPGLVYDGYVGSGRGNKCQFQNDGEGDVILKNFSNPILSGAVYVSFMFQVDSLPSTVNSGFCLALNPNDGSTSLNTRFMLKRLSDSTFQVGIQKQGLTVYSNEFYNVSQTYLGVTKYSFIDGSDNDSVKLYVFRNGVPTAEPSNALAGTIQGPDFNGLGDLHLSNNYAQGSMRGIKMSVDGIRIGNSWETSVLAILSGTKNETHKIAGEIFASPNPLQDVSKIRYTTLTSGFVDLKVFDSFGRPVASLVQDERGAGEHFVEWNAHNIPSGWYTCRMFMNGKASYLKLIKW